jgi:hypothetical protein
MELPSLPTLAAIDRISATFYNAVLLCKAKAAWQQFGARQPHHLKAALGAHAFHFVNLSGTLLNLTGKRSVAPM